MPTCPGCRERIPHRRLPAHVRYCPRVWTADSGGDQQNRAIDHLSGTLRTQERRLEARVERLEGVLSDLRTQLESARERRQ